MAVNIACMEPGKGSKIDPPLPPLPDLYLEKRARKSKVGWELILIGMGIGIALKAIGPAWVAAIFRVIKFQSGTEVSALAAALMAAIIAHESGHLCAALMLDFEVLGGSIGPFRVSRAFGKWMMRFTPRTMFSGSVTAIPRTRDYWRKRMVVVVAAGPAATLITGVIAGCVLFCVPLGAWLGMFISLFTQLSFFLFVLGLIPNAPKAQVRNDARLFCSLIRNTAEAQHILLYHLVAQLEVEGLRPRDYPEPLIRNLAAARSRPDMCLVYAHAILLWAIDRGDFSTANAWEQRTRDLSSFCNRRLQNLTLASSACFDLIFRKDMELARSKFADVDFDLLSPPYLMHRMKAAFHLASGRIPETLSEVAAAQYQAPKHLPYYEFERMLLGILHHKAITAPPKEIVIPRSNRAM